MNKKKFYEAPQMKVVEVKQSQLLCASPNEAYGEGSTDDWFD